MVLSWLITIPLVCCIAISFFVSYNKIKVLFLSFFPPYICLFFFFLFDKFYFEYKVLSAIGKGFYEFLKPIFVYSPKNLEALYLTSGTFLIMVIFLVLLLTFRILSQHFVHLSNPFNRGIGHKFIHLTYSILFMCMSVTTVFYFISGMRPALTIDYGFFEPIFNYFVPYSEVMPL